VILLLTPQEEGVRASQAEFGGLAPALAISLRRLLIAAGHLAPSFAAEPERNDLPQRNPKLSLRANISPNGKSSLTGDAKKGFV
jgi:hypothetical protein